MTVDLSKYLGVNRRLTRTQRQKLYQHVFRCFVDTKLRNEIAGMKVIVAGQIPLIIRSLVGSDFDVIKKYDHLYRSTVMRMLCEHVTGKNEDGSSVEDGHRTVFPANKGVSSQAYYHFSHAERVFVDMVQHETVSAQLSLELKEPIEHPTGSFLRIKHVCREDGVEGAPTLKQIDKQPWIGWTFNGPAFFKLPEDFQKQLHDLYLLVCKNFAIEREMRLEMLNFISEATKFKEVVDQWPEAADIADDLFKLKAEPAKTEKLSSARANMKARGVIESAA